MTHREVTEPYVRFDDRSSTGSAWILRRAIAHGEALHIHQVIEELAAAESHADRGAWVAVVVAYEAAAAFDPALRTHASPGDGIPYVWWTAFQEREPAQDLAVVASQVRKCWRADNVTAYPDAVQAIRDQIELGNVYQVNLTDRFHGTISGSPLELYSALVGVQSCQYGAYIDLGDRVVVSASPELFFTWNDDVITCRPMKGTAARHPRPSTDRLVGEQLVASTKDRAENVMIVDLLRNDVSRIAKLGTVRVPELFTLEQYETVWQLTSTVTAHVRPSTTLVDVFGALFPCGSVTGAPKVAAMQIIDRLESEPRGAYCGAIGLLAPPGAGTPRVTFSVPIRTAIVNPTGGLFVYGAGGGITWSSNSADEDREVNAKARILTCSQREFDLLETMLHQPDMHGRASVQHLDDHLARLAATADWFNRPNGHDSILDVIEALPVVAAPHRLRVTVNQHGQVAIDHLPLDPQPGPVALAVDRQTTRSDDPFCCHKTTWRRHYDDARKRHPTASDVILVNEHGNIIETTTANVLYRIADSWYTPPLEDGGLPGIARQRAIANNTISERSLHHSRLIEVDELAVLNDLRGQRAAILTGR